MKTLLKILQKIEDYILIIAFVGMVICAFAQVINRNFIHASIAWFEEVALYCMIYMALLGAEAGLRDGTQIAVTALTDKLKGTAKKVIALIDRLVVIIFSGNMLYWSIKMVGNQIATGQRSSALGVHMAVPYMALVISFGIIVVVQTGLLLISLKTWKEGKEVQA